MCLDFLESFRIGFTLDLPWVVKMGKKAKKGGDKKADGAANEEGEVCVRENIIHFEAE